MKLIGNIKPPAFSKFKDCIDDRWSINEEKEMSLGEVYNFNMSIDQTQKQFKQFFTLVDEAGYRLVDNTPYISLSLTACRGSVGAHNDAGYGLVALWLVRLAGLTKGRYAPWGDVPELYAGRKWKTIRMGDIVVFNANKEHAWLVNGTCHMLMQTVAKKRIQR